MKSNDLTIDRVLSGVLENDLPELYLLKDIVENDDTHLNDSVYSHTLRVSHILVWILENCRLGLRAYFNEKLIGRTRKELLETAALLHDIGKPDCFQIVGARTKCPGHEEYGATLVPEILDRFDFPEKEILFIYETILHHGEIYSLFSPEGRLLDEKLDIFQQHYPDYYKGQFVLLLSDIMGSQLRYHKIDQFEAMSGSILSLIREWEI